MWHLLENFIRNLINTFIVRASLSRTNIFRAVIGSIWHKSLLIRLESVSFWVIFYDVHFVTNREQCLPRQYLPPRVPLSLFIKCIIPGLAQKNHSQMDIYVYLVQVCLIYSTWSCMII